MEAVSTAARKKVAGLGITAGKVSPQLGDGWRKSYCRSCPYVVVYIYIYMCVCVLYVHNLGVMHGRFYGLNLKREMVVLENKPWRS